MLNYTAFLLQTMVLSIKNSSDSLVTQKIPALSLKMDKAWDADSSTSVPPPMALQKQEPENKCFGELGCFPVTYPWTDTNRPVAYFPESLDKVKPKFCLFTRTNPTECQQLHYNQSESIYRSFLVPAHRTYFISHGFLDAGDKPWVKYLTMRLLQKSDCNVITIDWSGGSKPPYTQAVANIRLVGAIGGHLIAAMNKWVGLKAEYCHAIGHSLGAHLSGYIGNTLRTKFNLTLGRISGMDPAKPHFFQTDPVVRLDPSDALFVDIVHTDITPFMEGGLGMDDPIGHMDFYPNSGETQPGCEHGVGVFINKENGSIVQGVRRFLGCDHIRSYLYYIESITVQCKYTGIQCDSWENFLAGECFGCRSEINPNGHICASMGFNSVKAALKNAALSGSTIPSPDFTNVKLYTITGSRAPFCRSLYRVTLRISDSKASRDHIGEYGQFKVELRGILGNTDEISIFKIQFFKPGTKWREVVADRQVGRVRNAILTFKHEFSLNRCRGGWNCRGYTSTV